MFQRLPYKLDGVPDEYDEYLFYVYGNSIEDLKNKIIEILSKNDKELYDFGRKAKEFVLKEKNNVVQAKKILNMINGEENGL